MTASSWSDALATDDDLAAISLPPKPSSKGRQILALTRCGQKHLRVKSFDAINCDEIRAAHAHEDLDVPLTTNDGFEPRQAALTQFRSALDVHLPVVINDPVIRRDQSVLGR